MYRFSEQIKLSDSIERKFTEVFDTSEWEIETDTGWEDITSSNKTIPYQRWTLILDSGNIIECADTHIVFDHNMQEVFVKDLIIGDLVAIECGFSTVRSVIKHDDEVEMYDLSVDSENHRFYSNGILSHNSVTSIAYMLHYMLFNKDKNCCILANKEAISKDLLERLKLAYEFLPKWLQQGIKEWNKSSIWLENDSKMIAASTSSSSVRGKAFSFIFLDEFAFIHPNQAMQFFESTYPTISSGTETRVIMVSTPKGMNHFYKFWVDAVEKRSMFIPIAVDWWDVPGRDEKWKAEQIANIGQESFDQEFGTEFLGSSGTLIDAQTLKRLVHRTPEQLLFEKKFKSYHVPNKSHIYVMTVDTAEGLGQDYTVATIFDVTTLPYKVVAVYRDNKVSPLLLPDILVGIGKLYNHAHMMIELNSAGKQVADLIRFDYDYENLLHVGSDTKNGQILMGKGVQQPGIKTSKTTKKVGCSILKDLMENNKLLVEDFDAISELSTFIRINDTFAADELANDDVVMTLVIFAWLTTQVYFNSLNDIDIRNELYAQQMQEVEDSILTFINPQAEAIIIVEEVVYDKQGIRWDLVTNNEE